MYLKKMEEIQKRYPRLLAQLRRHKMLDNDKHGAIRVIMRHKNTDLLLSDFDFYLPPSSQIIREAIKNRPSIASSLRINENISKRTERAKVFDALAWWKAGGDVEDNSIFWKPATIVRRYLNSSDRLHIVDVIFDEGNRQSKGHFEYGVKYIK